MPKMTTMEFARISSMALALPKRNRLQLEQLLSEKREAEQEGEGAEKATPKEEVS